MDGAGFAQTKPATMPDAQIEANVLKALAGAPELADQSITSTTVYGTVTLNGTVRDEPSRDLAEHLVANTAGVQKVVDQLTIGVPAAASNDSQQAGTNPNLQSDGTMAPPQGQTPQAQSYPAPQARRRMVLLRSRVSIRLTAATIGPVSAAAGSVSSALVRRHKGSILRRVSILRLTVRLRKRANILRSRDSIRLTAALPIASRILLSIRSSRMLLKKGEMRWLFRVDPSCGFGSIRG